MLRKSSFSAFSRVVLIFGSLILVACGKSETSHLKVHNGDIQNDPTGPVRKTSGGSGKCTGTFVAPRVFVTAGHCDSEKQVLSHDERLYLNLIDCRTSPDFDLEIATAIPFLDQHDWRICATDGDASLIGVQRFMSVATREPEEGDRITFYGYGHSDLPNSSGSGLLRRGTGQIDHISDAFTMSASIEGLATRQATASGDSGGPWVNQKGELIGVVMSGTGPKSAVELDRVEFNATSVFDPGFMDAIKELKRLYPSQGNYGPGATTQVHLGPGDVDGLTQQISSAISQFPPGSINCQVLRDSLMPIMRGRNCPHPLWITRPEVLAAGPSPVVFYSPDFSANNDCETICIDPSGLAADPCVY